MGIKIIRDLKEKQRTINLYLQAFEDTKKFVDYYYNEKCKDNVVIVWDEGGEIISMLHLNPYKISVCGKIFDTYYVVAVATDREHRHKGYMTRLLNASFELMKKEHIPFCFLLPVDKAIYEWIGFFEICRFTNERGEDGIVNNRKTISELNEGYEVFCVRDEPYLRRLKMEDKLAMDGEEEVLPENPVIMAKITDYDKLSEAVPVNVSRDKYEEWLAKRKCYFSEEI